MKKHLFIVFFAVIMASCTHKKEQPAPTFEEVVEQPLNFPEDYLGIYKGDLEIISSNGTQKIPMEFHLLDAPDSTKYAYKIYYGKERSERSYNLLRTHNKNLFLVDENNGIVLESGYANGTLFSTYEVMGNLLNSTEKFYKDRMEFTITMAREIDTSITGNEESAIVKNYPISIMQTATLMKQTAINE